MLLDQQKHRQAAELYLAPDQIVDRCGWGMDGTVFESTRRSAVKVHEYTVRFQNELAVYRRLTDEGVERICGASIPKLLGVDDARLIIELTTVRAPYVLDFAASRLDVPPDFDAELWQHWREEKEEEFGPHWPSAMRVFDELRLKYGIWHMDLSPRNVDLNQRET